MDIKPNIKPSAFLLQHWNGVLPVDMHQVAKTAGFSIEYFDEFDRDDQCLMTKILDGKLCMFVRRDMVDNRERFAIAYAIGRICTGGNLECIDCVEDYSTGVQNPDKKRAQDFAMKLLVPLDVFKRTVMGGKLGAHEICKLFGVSMALLNRRIDSLR